MRHRKLLHDALADVGEEPIEFGLGSELATVEPERDLDNRRTTQVRAQIVQLAERLLLRGFAPGGELGLEPIERRRNRPVVGPGIGPVGEVRKHGMTLLGAQPIEAFAPLQALGRDRDVGRVCIEERPSLCPVFHADRGDERGKLPLAILGGESVGEVVERLIGALPMGTSSQVTEVLPKKRA